jgi:hypothetical protein
MKERGLRHGARSGNGSPLTGKSIAKLLRCPRITVDGWRIIDDDDYNQSVGEPQAEGVMSIAASFSLS